MIRKHPLIAHRLRRLQGGFAAIEHRFLRDGFWAALDHHELLLYIFLVLVADRQGMSYYSYDKICSLICVSLDEYIVARDGLIDKDLIAFDGRLFQVLSLPAAPKCPLRAPLVNREDMCRDDPATVRQLIVNSLKGAGHDR